MTDINSFTEEIDNFKEILERKWEEAEQSIVRGEQEDWNQGLLRFLNSNVELIEVFIKLDEANGLKTGEKAE